MGISPPDHFHKYLYMKQTGVPKERILTLARLEGKDCDKLEEWLNKGEDSEKKIIPYDTTLTDEYIAAVSRQADIVHDFRQEEFSGDVQEASLVKDILGPDDDYTAKPGTEPMAFVIRNVLTPTECDELIDAAEDFGIGGGPKYVARTAKRTSNYVNADLSKKIEKRIKHILDSKFREEKEIDDSNPSNKDEKNQTSKYMGPFYGIHTNWRVLRYDAEGGDGFPAHQDQMDSLKMPKKDGSGRKDFCVSSHTLLLQLSEGSLEGGCTRFYPRAKVRIDPSDRVRLQGSELFRMKQFDHAVDVLLPRGWALVFKQRGLLHAGQPVSTSSPCPKYVAQSGVLRVLPEGVLSKPSVFKNGPGVTNGAF
mmetsp:Transcript_13099/g.17548  ORF Transcript_13099/g.17548 Transcript_13099/m.17548 type:complete len:365 (+) Transcript_13099:133-1227(+)